MRAVMYGAGNIGRGFIGQLFASSRYEVTFIDVADNVIDAINRDGRYPVRILSEDAFEDRWVDGVKAVNGNNKEAAALAIAECNVMATAVGVRVLPFIAPVIAAGIKKRLEAGGGALNIIICENLINANKILEGLIKDHLSEEEKCFFDERVGLVEASIGRMVPIQKAEMQDGNPLRVCVEAYGFLPVDKDAFKGEIPQIAGMYPFDNFDFYIQRKLFVHNMGHATCAYFGMVKGDEYIYQTVRRSSILFIAQNAMLESALALSAEFNKPLPDLHFHIRDLLNRFSNKALGDTCARVGGDTARKLGPEDRLVGAIKCCAGQGITPAFISAGAGAALYVHLKEKQLGQNREAAETVLSTISGLARESEEAKRIILFYAMICEGADFKDIIALAAKTGNKQII
ncbi:MAG: mannitol-1-phosphate 5-dehydrogenase [Treponema sp.]|nr:mannitol-1-phosphate 5-dehydrogenase [Treponema sp.]